MKIPINRKRARSYDEKRRRITKAAARLFIKEGYTKTTIQDIAREGGLSIGALYHYISSKADILSLFIDWQISYLDSFIKSHSDILLSKDPVESLSISIKTYITAVDELRDVILFWYQEARNIPPDKLQRLLEMEVRLTDIFVRIIGAGCEAGEFHVRDVALAAHNINTLGDMWAFRRWFLLKHCTLNHFIREQTKFIISGLRSGKY